MRAYNFGDSGRTSWKFNHGNWLEAWVIKCTLILQDVLPTKFGRAKMSKIRRNFWQLSTLIANISGTDQRIENRKSTWSTTFHPLLAKKSRWTLVHQPKSYSRACWPTQLDFFRETIFRPLEGAVPSNFTRPTSFINCISSRTWGAGRPQVGLCPIFLVIFSSRTSQFRHSLTNCFSFWGRRSLRPPTGALPLDLTGGLSQTLP